MGGRRRRLSVALADLLARSRSGNFNSADSQCLFLWRYLQMDQALLPVARGLETGLLGCIICLGQGKRDWGIRSPASLSHTHPNHDWKIHRSINDHESDGADRTHEHDFFPKFVRVTELQPRSKKMVAGTFFVWMSMSMRKERRLKIPPKI